MPRGKFYSEQSTIDAITFALMESPEKLYKSNCLNWNGITNDSKTYYTEIISNILLNNLKYFQNIPKIDRIRQYKILRSAFEKKDKGKGEDNFAKGIMNEDLEQLGKVIAYQIPINNSRNDGAGKVDLLSYNNKSKIFYLIELKYKNSKESLLRAALEIYTYFKQINQEKLLSEFKNHGNTQIKSLKLQPIVLLYEGSQSCKDALEIHEGKRPLLKHLLETLGIEIYNINFKIKKI